MRTLLHNWQCQLVVMAAVRPQAARNRQLDRQDTGAVESALSNRQTLRSLRRVRLASVGI